jgi:N-acetyl-gamma-glutamyl-phosphate reductase
MVNIAILGATGYGGVELVRLLQAHPHVRLAYLSSETYAGQRMCDVYPHLATVETVLQPLDAGLVAASCDVALMALPAGASTAAATVLLEAGVRIVDVSPDFRLRDASLYAEWYGFQHSAPHLLSQAVFGLPELHREHIRRAALVAAPGCYTTAALLALAPLAAEGLIDAGDIVIDGKSGISGAGRTSLALAYHYPEADEDLSAYSVGGHRHVPEMVQELEPLARGPVRIAFVPHLVPMARGILMTMYVRAAGGADAAALRSCLERRYAQERFVSVLPQGRWPHTKWTAGTNRCYLAVGEDRLSGRLVVAAAIDNLGKGMSGQMVQCLNIMLGHEEDTALSLHAAYP